MPSPIQWQKSTFSGGGSHEDCIEMAGTRTGIQLRESEAPADVLTTTGAPLRALLAAIKSGVTKS